VIWRKAGICARDGSNDPFIIQYLELEDIMDLELAVKELSAKLDRLKEHL